MDQVLSTDRFAVAERLRSLHVGTPRDSDFRALIEGLLCHDADGNPVPEARHFTETGETRGVMVVAGSGGGKTTMIEQALTNHPALSSDDPERVPVVSVRVPSPASTKGLGLAVLEATGYAGNGERLVERQVWNRVRHRLKQLHTLVLWIDEAQELFRTKGQQETRNMPNTIKSQMQGDGSVVVVLSGIDELRQIASTDPQITRRFRTMTLREVSEAGDGDMLWSILKGYCAKAGPASPERGNLVGRLIYACRGQFGLCIEMIVDAIELAIGERAEALDHQHFAEVFAVHTDCDYDKNVFLSTRWSQINLDRLAA